MSDYGNISGTVYVVASFLAVFAVLAAYTAFVLKARKNTLRELQDEGLLEKE